MVRYVSILVLLDVCKERRRLIQLLARVNLFQSLFYWMYVKNKNLYSPKVQLVLCFNPCFIGCM